MAIAVFLQGGSVMAVQSVTMAVMSWTVKITLALPMTSAVKMEKSAFLWLGGVIRMMTAEICLMRLVVTQVHHVIPVSSHVTMVCVLMQIGFVTTKTTAEIGVMSLIVHRVNVMHPVSSDAQMAHVLTSIGNVMERMTAKIILMNRVVGP